MDEAKYLNFINSLIGQSMKIELRSEEYVEDETAKYWKAVAKMVVGGTRDGENWGEVEFVSGSFDTDSISAFSTVLASCLNFMSSDDFHETLLDEVEKSETKNIRLLDEPEDER